MARQSKDPGTLMEIFAALDNDPFLIAEILARQVLADRFARNWFASDERVHGWQERLLQDLRGQLTIDNFRSLGANLYRDVHAAVSVDAARQEKGVLELTKEEFDDFCARFPEPGQLSPLQETRDDFVVRVTYSGRNRNSRAGLSGWPRWISRPGLIQWAALSAPCRMKRRIHLPVALGFGHARARRSRPPRLVAAALVRLRSRFTSHRRLDGQGDDRLGWTGNRQHLLGHRSHLPSDSSTTGGPWRGPNAGGPGGMSAVWTGREMIVWGGHHEAWLLSAMGAGTFQAWGNGRPRPRASIVRQAGRAIRPFGPGRYMIIWGGETSSYVFASDGALYDPDADGMDDLGNPRTRPLPANSIPPCGREAK